MDSVFSTAAERMKSSQEIKMYFKMLNFNVLPVTEYV